MEFEMVRLYCKFCRDYTAQFISGSGNKRVCDYCCKTTATISGFMNEKSDKNKMELRQEVKQNDI